MGIKALKQGWANYFKDTDVAPERLERVKKCEHLIDAPISQLRVKDRYPEISGKICGKCYCPMPAKIRQDLDKCECWKDV